MAKSEKQKIIRWERGKTREIKDDIVVESSLELVINDRSAVTLLCSPESQRALAVGYMKSEGLIEDLESVKELEFCPEDKTIEARIAEDRGDMESYFERKRALTSSCGRATAIVENLKALELTKSEMDNTPEFTELVDLINDLQQRAELFQKTGGSHTAALGYRGEIKYLAEDIGRHNAVDKVIGRAVLDERSLEEFFLLTSGRLSSEMVLKAIRSSIPILVSRSAPTTLAVRMGRMTGLVMVGFVRGTRLSVYSGREKFKGFG